MLIGPWVQQLLIRRPFLRNLLHKLFSGNQPLLNQQLRQCVGLREAGDEKFFHRDRSFIRFSRCAPHFMTLSARNSTDCRIVRLSAFAVLRFMTNSNLVGCSIGMSAGLAPFRILSTYVAARRYIARSSVEYDMRPPASTQVLP